MRKKSLYHIEVRVSIVHLYNPPPSAGRLSDLEEEDFQDLEDKSLAPEDSLVGNYAVRKVAPDPAPLDLPATPTESLNLTNHLQSPR